MRLPWPVLREKKDVEAQNDRKTETETEKVRQVVFEGLPLKEYVHCTWHAAFCLAILCFLFVVMKLAITIVRVMMGDSEIVAKQCQVPPKPLQPTPPPHHHHHHNMMRAIFLGKM